MAEDPQKTWVVMAAAIGIVSVLFGGSWTVFQTQFGYIKEDKDIIRLELVRSLANIQTQFKTIDESFERRRALNVEQVEFKQFEKHSEKLVADIQQRLLLIEQTRPTTGELQGIARNADGQINRILDRLDRLEKPR